MKKPKKYKIDSLEKLINVANSKNINALSIDFLLWFNMVVQTNENIRKQHPEASKGKENFDLCKPSFIWIADGKNDIKSVELTNTKTGEVTTIKL